MSAEFDERKFANFIAERDRKSNHCETCGNKRRLLICGQCGSGFSHCRCRDVRCRFCGEWQKIRTPKPEPESPGWVTLHYRTPEEMEALQAAEEALKNRATIRPEMFVLEEPEDTNNAG